MRAFIHTRSICPIYQLNSASLPFPSLPPDTLSTSPILSCLQSRPIFIPSLVLSSTRICKYLSVTPLTNPPHIGNATYAGAFAAIMANVVLIAYIVVAMNEEDESKSQVEKKGQ